jgi:hypothetical protein
VTGLDDRRQKKTYVVPSVGMDRFKAVWPLPTQEDQ